MTQQNDKNPLEELRSSAERILKNRDLSADEQKEWEDIEKLVHELQVHRIELEVQNQDLMQSQKELMESQEALKDLFDFAPVAYFILDEERYIERANLAAANLIDQGVDRLTGKRFSQFVVYEDSDIFYRHHRRLTRTREPQMDEFQIKDSDGQRIYVQAQSTVIDDTDRIRVSLTDITRRRQSEMRLRRLRELDRAILRLQDGEEIVWAASRQLQQITGCDVVAILLFDEQDMAIYHNPDDMRIRRRKVSNVPGHVLQAFEADDQAEKTITNANVLEGMALPAGQYRFVPIVRSGQVEGLVGLGNRHTLPASDLVPAAQEVAVQLGIAVYQAYLFNQVKQQAEWLESEVETRTHELRESESQFRLLAENMQDVVTLHTREGHIEYVSPSAADQLGWSPDRLYDEGVLKFIHKEDFEDPVLCLLGRHRFRLRHADGSDLWFESSGQLTEGEQDRIVTTFRNIHAQVIAETRREEQQAFTDALLTTTREIAGTLNLEDVLDTLLDSLQKVIPYNGANVMLLSEDEAVARVVRLKGYDHPKLETWLYDQSFELEEEVAEQLLAEKQPLIGAPAANMLRWPDYMQENPLQSHVSTPILIEDEVIGLLNVDSYEAGLYTEVEAQRLQSFAQQAAVAIRKAQLHHKEQELAVLEERQRIARDLHDAVNQNLFAAVYFTDVLLATTDDTVMTERLNHLHKSLSASQAEMRTLLLELRPENIERPPMEDLFDQLVEGFQSRGNIPVDVEIDMEREMPTDIKILVFRITQEALNNIAKHAEASCVSIQLVVREERLRLAICDDGSGFDPERHLIGHHGLASMRERARNQGARIFIESREGEGSVITLSASLEEKDQQRV